MTPSAALRHPAVMQAAAHSLNEELTIIRSALQLIDEAPAGEDIRPLLVDVGGAVARCMWQVHGLLHYAKRNGARPSSTTAQHATNGPYL